MPGAQGSIRVARKAKDGNDGLDAVSYWLVPSATQVKRKTDGTLYPTIVTCKRMKKTGNYASVESGEGTLAYSCAYLDGTVTGQMPYPTSGVSVTKAMSYIRFAWVLDSVEVATETVLVMDDGDDGVGISSITEYYAKSTSGTSVPTSGWSTTVPALDASNKYLWNYEKTTYTDGTSKTTDAHVVGVYGNDGRGISGIEEYYLATSASSGVTTSTSGWTTTVQTITEAKRYLWNYEKITYTSGNPTYSTPHIIGVYGQQGVPGAAGSKTILLKSSYSQPLATWKTWAQNSDISSGFSDYANGYTVASTTEVNVGDVAQIQGTISDMGNVDCLLVGTVVKVENATRVWINKTSLIYGPKGGGGNPGADGLTILVSPENLVFSREKSEIERKVKVEVWRGSTKLNYATSGGYTCGFLGSTTGTGKYTTGLIWNFKTETDAFYYTLTYAAGNDVNEDIPFQITVGGVVYTRMITVRTVKDGAQGVPGPSYQPLRVREWSTVPAGTLLTTGLESGDLWTDIVYIKSSAYTNGVKYWRCIKSFTKQSTHTPPANNTDTSNALYGYLISDGISYSMVATDILLANYAVVKNLGVESIEMRDASGNVLFMAKGGAVTCNVGNFNNINVSGDFTINTLKLKMSTADHSDSENPALPNGSLCYDVNAITLPNLTSGECRSIRVLNPIRTKTEPQDLVLKPASTMVRISKTLSDADAITGGKSLTLAGYGQNGGKFLELIGIKISGALYTYWLVSSLNSGV